RQTDSQGVYEHHQDQAIHAHSCEQAPRAQAGRTPVSRRRGDGEPRYLESSPMERNEQSSGTARRGPITAIVLIAGLLSGCASTRPAKYYQLTVPTEAGAIEKADAVPVTLLVGGLVTTHVYAEDRIVYGNGPEQ